MASEQDRTHSASSLLFSRLSIVSSACDEPLQRLKMISKLFRDNSLARCQAPRTQCRAGKGFGSSTAKPKGAGSKSGQAKTPEQVTATAAVAQHHHTPLPQSTPEPYIWFCNAVLLLYALCSVHIIPSLPLAGCRACPCRGIWGSSQGPTSRPS
jgi:hypothetical protein